MVAAWNIQRALDLPGKAEAKNGGKNDQMVAIWPFLSLPWYPQIRSLS